MARLISYQQIHDEKINRSRSWIDIRMNGHRKPPFPRPVSRVPRFNKHLWDEDEVDAWVAQYIESEKKKAMEYLANILPRKSE